MFRWTRSLIHWRLVASIAVVLFLSATVGASDDGGFSDNAGFADDGELTGYATRLDEPAFSEWHVAAGGELMFMRPENFGLAVHWEQLLVKTVIPACDHGFDYCLYYFGDEYAGTNFQSAGVRMNRRADLGSADMCLFTSPAGYVEFEPTVRYEDGYAVATFAPIQSAAAGSYSEGALFRLALGDAACFEVETRIGVSRFENYAEGSIREVTDEERDALEEQLREVVRTIRLVDRPSVVLFAWPRETCAGETHTYKL